MGRFDPEAGELVGQVAASLTLPGVVAAGITAAVGALAVLTFGFVVALVFPDQSLIGAVGNGVGTVTEAFRQVPQLLSADVFSGGLFGTGPTRAAPFLLVAVPIAACALAARAQAARVAELALPLRLAWAAGVGVLFGILCLILSLFGGGGEGGVDPALGDVFGLGLVWGTIGALVGLARSSAAEGARAAVTGPRTERLQSAFGLVGAALRPLAAVLVLCALIGLWAWLVQTARDVGNVQGSRSEALALVENGLYLAEHGVHFSELGALTQFGGPGALETLGMPFPVEDPVEVVSGGDFRAFGYRDALPAYVFVPGLIALFALQVLGALYAGFAVSRRRPGQTIGRAAAYGALVGPIWAITVAILSSLASKQLYGDPSGDSVFVTFLLGGAALGALGGVLAARSGPQAAAPGT